MKKENKLFKVNEGKVYFINKANEERLKKEEKIVYTQDKQFALVYTKNDLSNIQEFYELSDYKTYQQIRSIEDEIYDNFINEFEIEENEYEKWLLVGRKINQNLEIALSFQVDELSFGCLINRLDSIKQGSNVIYGLVDQTKTSFITYAIRNEENQEEANYEK
jgi:hypothetical protein